MPSTFPFDAMLILSSLGVLLLAGLILRAKVSFFQKFFVPACIIAGLIGLFLRTLGLLPISKTALETLVYHIFNITFISLGLTPRSETANKKKELRDVSIMGLLIVSVAALQFVIGGLFTLFFNLFGYNLFPTFGFLVTMGFEEGPGQALSIGKSWENFGFANASTVGLSFAAIGFMFAIFVGIPFVSWAIRRGYITQSKSLSSSFVTGIFKKAQQKESTGIMTTHPATIDSLTFHFSLIGVVYILTYSFLKLMDHILPSDLAKMYWGFFFIWGLLIAYIFRILIEKTKLDYLVDAGIQSRITGWSVDMLVTGAITAISIQVIWTFIVPITVMSIVAGVATIFWILYFGRKLWNRYTFERIAGLYGMETGTIATGLILVRVADPDFDTPAAIDLAVSGIVALPVLFFMMHLMNAPILWNWSIATTSLIFFVILIITIILFFSIARKNNI